MVSFRKLIIVSLIILAILASGFFIITPFLVSRIKAASEELIEAKRHLSELSVNQEQYVYLMRDFNEIEAGIKKIDQSFYQEEQFLSLVQSLEQAASQTNNRSDIQIKEKDQKSEAGKDGQKTISMQISLWGSYPSLLKYLYILENLAFINEIEIIQLQRASQARADVNLNAGDIYTNLNLKVYRSKK